VYCLLRLVNEAQEKVFQEITNKSIAIAAFIPPGLPDVPT
jgi:hypothetical protein